MDKGSLTELISLYSKHDWYTRLYIHGRSRLLMLDYYSEFFTAQGLIVDVGCGYGVLANWLSLCAPERQVLGIDLNKKRIAAARKTIGSRQNIDFLTEDAAMWSWPRCAGISMTDVLHHLSPPGQEAVLQKAHDALQEDGVLLVSEVDPTARPFYRYWASYLSDRVLYPMSRAHFRKPGDWKSTLSGLGFDVRIIKLRNPIFAGVLLVCRKLTAKASNESRVLQT